MLSARTTYAVLYFLQGASSMEVATSCSPAIKRKDGRLCRAQSENTRSSSSGGSGVKDKMFRVLVDPPPTGTFFAGSEITGCVQVETQEEKKFKYIHVSLTGRAQVMHGACIHGCNFQLAMSPLHNNVNMIYSHAS